MPEPLTTAAAGYLPLDLDAVRAEPVDIFEDPHEVTLGERTLHGIPFSFGTPERAVALVRANDSVTLPVGRSARWLVFAHAVLETDLFEGGNIIGDHVGSYTLRYADDTTHSADLRQRFELGPTPRKWDGRPLPLDWGQTPFLAVNDAAHELMDRVCGRYDEAGARLVDIEDPQSRVPYVLPYRFYLWAMPNPHPENEIVELIAAATGQSLLIGAVTTSDLEESPFTRAAARPMLISLPGRDVDETISVEIDRGSATYVFRTTPPYDALSSLPPGWGRARPDEWHNGYTRISASPSATVSILADDEQLVSFTWGDLLAKESLDLGDVSVALPPAGQAWVAVSIRDAAGELAPCRLRFQTAEGIPLAPYGHHAHINSDGGTWNLDIGGDVRLGSDTSAFVAGRVEGWLPIGEVDIEVSRGFEFRPARHRVTITAETSEIELPLERLFDSAARGYRSGDTHVHFVSTQGAELEARAEDVAVTNLLQSQWGHLFTSTEEYTGRPHVSAAGDAVVFTGQENRTNMLGHINLLGLREPIMPWCTGGSEEADLGGGLETTLSHWADECRAQGGTVVLAHFPVPYGETAALLATGRLDAVETIAFDEYNISEYYRYLNAGYRVPLAAGTDKMTSEVPIGMMRTYAGVTKPDVDYWDWSDGIRRGDTMVSSGPMLWLTVDGERPGSVLIERDGGVTARVELETVFAVDEVEILMDGRVVHVERIPDGAETHAFELPVELEGSSWIAARCVGRDDLRHADTWSRPVFAHTSPVYVSTDAEWRRYDASVIHSMMATVEGARRYVADRARTEWAGTTRHRHGEADHMAYLDRPFREALDALSDRLEREGGSR